MMDGKRISAVRDIGAHKEAVIVKRYGFSQSIRIETR